MLSLENCRWISTLGEALRPKKELTHGLLHLSCIHLLPYEGDANTFSFALGCGWLKSLCLVKVCQALGLFPMGSLNFQE